MDRDHMIGHAAWLAHKAAGCDCDMDNPPTFEVMRIEAALPYLEEKLRADERLRVSMELAAFAEELQSAGRPTMAACVKEMWTRVTRRLDK